MAYVQAKTLCNILILKKIHVDQIQVNFPTVAKELAREAQTRLKETDQIQTAYNIKKDNSNFFNEDREVKDLEKLYSTPEPRAEP